MREWERKDRSLLKLNRRQALSLCACKLGKVTSDCKEPSRMKEGSRREREREGLE